MRRGLRQAGGIKTTNETARTGLSALQTRAEASAAVKQIAHLASLLKMAAAARDAELLAVTEKHGALLESIAKDIWALELRVKEWAEANRKEEFGEAQAIEFPNGWARYRQGPVKLALYAGGDWQQVLLRVLAFGPTSQWDRYVKREPDLDRQGLLRDAKGEHPLLTQARLKIIGLRLEREEFFRVEPKPEVSVLDVPS